MNGITAVAAEQSMAMIANTNVITRRVRTSSDIVLALGKSKPKPKVGTSLMNCNPLSMSWIATERSATAIKSMSVVAAETKTVFLASFSWFRRWTIATGMASSAAIIVMAKMALMFEGRYEIEIGLYRSSIKPKATRLVA